MPKRILLAGMLALIGTTALAATQAPPGRCTGADCRTAARDLHRNHDDLRSGRAGGQIMADALIDFGKRRVSGFSVGSQPIVVLTTSVIGFGRPRRKREHTASSWRGRSIGGAAARRCASASRATRQRFGSSSALSANSSIPSRKVSASAELQNCLHDEENDPYRDDVASLRGDRVRALLGEHAA